MFRVVASAPMPIDIGPILGSQAALEAPQSGSLLRATLLEAVADADALIALLDVAVDAELLDRAKNLRVVANFAVGTDNVDVERATALGIAVTNTPDVLTEATADFAFALLLGAARRLRECDQLARSGQWAGWQPDLLLGAPVAGQTLGIIGMGRIGRAVARRARGFTMNVLYASRHTVPEEDALGAERKSIEALARESDFVTLHCPLTAETRHLVDSSFLQTMKSTATLINTARGGCVDEQALIAALLTREISAAGLDVFEDEPRIPEALRNCGAALLAPHAGSATTTARAQMATICADAVRAVIEGKRPDTIINPGVWPAGRGTRGGG